MLSQEQKELVNKNINLVYSIATKMKLTKNRDAIQEGFLGLCKAAERYDSNLSKFSTYATTYIRGYMQTFLRNNCVIKPERKLNSFNYASVESYEDELHTIPTRSTEDISEIRDIIISADSTTKEILKLYYNGYSQKEIGMLMKVSQASISRKIRNIGKELM